MFLLLQFVIDCDILHGDFGFWSKKYLNNATFGRSLSFHMSEQERLENVVVANMVLKINFS